VSPDRGRKRFAAWVSELMAVRLLFPAAVALLAAVAVTSVPRLLPRTDPRLPVRSVAALWRVVRAPQSAGAVRLGPGEVAGRVGNHVFLTARSVPPGPLTAVIRLQRSAATPAPAAGFRMFWTARDWAFRPDGYVELSGPPSNLVSPPFDPSGAEPLTGTLQLRLDMPDGEEGATVAEVLLDRAANASVPVTLRGEQRDAFLTGAGEELAFAVEPWGTGVFRTAVGVRYAALPPRAAPIEIVAVASAGGAGSPLRKAFAIPDSTGREVFAPAWVPLALDLSAWRGARVEVTLVARGAAGGALPPHTQICWAMPALF
jgi:hypothetical protein